MGAGETQNWTSERSVAREITHATDTFAEHSQPETLGVVANHADLLGSQGPFSTIKWREVEISHITCNKRLWINDYITFKTQKSKAFMALNPNAYLTALLREMKQGWAVLADIHGQLTFTGTWVFAFSDMQYSCTIYGSVQRQKCNA